MSYYTECENCETILMTDDPNDPIGHCRFCDELVEFNILDGLNDY